MKNQTYETAIRPKAGQHIAPSIPDDLMRSFILLSIKKKIPTQTFFLIREFLREYGNKVGDVNLKQMFDLAYQMGDKE